MKKERFLELMNNIDDDLILRAEQAKPKQRRTKTLWVKWGVVAACLCLSVGTVLAVSMQRAQPAVNPHWSQPSVDTSGHVQPPVESSKPAETKPTVITADTPDPFTESDVMIPKKSEVFISPMLQELMKQDYETDVVFRVAVKILYTQEDHDECTQYVDSNEEVASLHQEWLETEAAYHALWEQLRGTTDDEKWEEYDEMVRRANALHDQWLAAREECFDVYWASMVHDRVEYARTLGATNISEITDPYVRAYIMDLSADMINDMAAQGGYLFRMASPDGEEDFDIPGDC